MPVRPPRRPNSIRKTDFDYRSPGAYFITLCVEGRKRLFGRVRQGRISLSPLGQLVDRELRTLSSRLPHIRVDAFVVMPDHLHVILRLLGPVPEGGGPTIPGPPTGSVGAAVGQMKSRVTKSAVGAGLWCAGERLWQRGYYDRIVRSNAALARVRRYISLNPVRWTGDRASR